LAGVGIKREKSLGGLDGSFSIVLALEAHVPLAEAAYAMRIDGHQPALEVTWGTANLAESHLETHAVGDCTSPKEFVDGCVAGKKRQSVGQLKDPLVQGAAVPQSGTAQCRLVKQLQRKAWSHNTPDVVPSSRIPGPRPPIAATRGRVARCRPGFP